MNLKVFLFRVGFNVLALMDETHGENQSMHHENYPHDFLAELPSR